MEKFNKKLDERTKFAKLKDHGMKNAKKKL